MSLSVLNGTLSRNRTDFAGKAQAPSATVVALAIFLSSIGIVGVLGNVLVTWVVLMQRQLRKHVTNLLILNLAVADCTVAAAGLVEVALLVEGKGWSLGLVACRLDRYVLVSALYASILLLSSVCVERYVAIVHAMKAHLWIRRRNAVKALCIVWTVACVAALPTVFFNQVRRRHPHAPELCIMLLPGPAYNLLIYKYAEFFVFFLGPVILQLVLYVLIGIKLMESTRQLRQNGGLNSSSATAATSLTTSSNPRESAAMKKRKSVVKMLIACVVVYFISYLPVQVPLLWNSFANAPLKTNWAFYAFLMTMGQINSAANPVFYGIFCKNYRLAYKRAIFVWRKKDARRSTKTTTEFTDTLNPVTSQAL